MMAILTYTVVFSVFTILRHYDFQSSGWDLGIYMQSLYTASFHGRPLSYTIEQFTQNPSNLFFGVHFSPLVFSLVPLYRLAPFAETLLVLQSFVIALGAFGLYKLTYFIHANRFVSLSLAASYLLCTPLQAVNWFDFHIQAFIPIFFFMMFLFYVEKKYVWSFVFFLLTISTIELMPVLLFPFGIYCLLNDHKNKKAIIYGLSIMALSILWFLLGAYVKALINPMSSSTFGAWSIWGNGYLQILGTIVTRPLDALIYLFTVYPLEKTLYFIWLMAPLLFLPLFARREFVLLVTPWIVMVFLSTYVGYFTNQYAAFVVPQLFIAAVYGLKQLSKSVEHIEFKKSLLMRYSKWMLWAAIAAFILVGPFAIESQARGVYVHGLPQDTANKAALRNALQLVPDQASVYTTFRIEPHLANRLRIYAQSVPDIAPDFIVLDLKLPDSSISLETLGGPGIVGADDLLNEYNYTLIYSDDGVLVYKLGANSGSANQSIVLTFNYNDLALDFGTLTSDGSSQSGYVLTHRITDWPYGFWHGPYAALPRGQYEVTYRLRSDGVPDGHLLTLDVTSDLGQTLLARKYVYSHDLESDIWQNLTLRFETDEPRVFVEFRGTFAANSTTKELDFIEVRQCSSSANATFGTTDFNHGDMTVMDGNLTSSDVTYRRNTDPTAFSFASYVEAPAGNYSAGLWLRLDSFSQGQLFSLAVHDLDENELARMEVSVADFSGKESWAYFSCSFVANSTNTFLEIIGKADGSVSMSFSYLELRALEET